MQQGAEKKPLSLLAFQISAPIRITRVFCYALSGNIVFAPPDTLVLTIVQKVHQPSAS